MEGLVAGAATGLAQPTPWRETMPRGDTQPIALAVSHEAR